MYVCVRVCVRAYVHAFVLVVGAPKLWDALVRASVTSSLEDGNDGYDNNDDTDHGACNDATSLLGCGWDDWRGDAEDGAGCDLVSGRADLLIFGGPLDGEGAVVVRVGDVNFQELGVEDRGAHLEAIFVKRDLGG